MDSRLILEKLYGKQARAGWARRVWSRLRSGRGLLAHRRGYPASPSHRNLVLAAGSLIVSTCVLAHIYYYNQLVELHARTQQTWAQVEALQQQRAHIQDSLTEISRRYSQYEQDLLSRVTAMRTGTPLREATPPAEPNAETDLEALLSRIRIVAEEYPELRFGDTLHQLSAAMVTNESQITKAVMDHNTAVGRYTTCLAQFPASVFGRIAGFRPERYYDPGDERTLGHRRIAF